MLLLPQFYKHKVGPCCLVDVDFRICCKFPNVRRLHWNQVVLRDRYLLRRYSKRNMHWLAYSDGEDEENRVKLSQKQKRHRVTFMRHKYRSSSNGIQKIVFHYPLREKFCNSTTNKGVSAGTQHSKTLIDTE